MLVQQQQGHIRHSNSRSVTVVWRRPAIWKRNAEARRIPKIYHMFRVLRFLNRSTLWKYLIYHQPRDCHLSTRITIRSSILVHATITQLRRNGCDVQQDRGALVGICRLVTASSLALPELKSTRRDGPRSKLKHGVAGRRSIQQQKSERQVRSRSSEDAGEQKRGRESELPLCGPCNEVQLRMSHLKYKRLAQATPKCHFVRCHFMRRNC